MKRDLCRDDSYILKYEINIKDDGSKEIIIYYANGSKEHKPYFKEEEINVLRTQKRQIETVSQNADSYRREANKSKLKTVLLSAIAIMYAGILFSTFNIPTLIATGLFTYFAVKSADKTLTATKKFKEVEKYKIFLRNEDVINDVLEGKNALTEEYEHDRDNDIRLVNANTIDDFDYKTIKSAMRLTGQERKDWGDDDTSANLVSQEFEYYKDKIKSKVKVLKR